jgi:uncharacterized membrane-anchored protein
MWALSGSLVLAPTLSAQETAGIAQIQWQHGPAVAKVGDGAEITLTKGYMFTGATGARKFLELTENPPRGDELGILAPEEVGWFAIFRFDAVGYVKDDETNSLDADAMLKTIHTATAKSNEERRRKGWGTLTPTGWLTPPHYDVNTHNLEWTISARDDREGVLVANHNTRLLGRSGVMSVSLVTNPEQLSISLSDFRKVMLDFAYTPQNNYRAWVKGDKVAEYGLTALVVGGATAVATKTGVWKVLWKLIVAAIVGIGALLKKLFGSRSGGETSSSN